MLSSPYGLHSPEFWSLPRVEGCWYFCFEDWRWGPKLSRFWFYFPIASSSCHLQGDRKCCFYSSNESIQHLFFDCHFAKFIRRIVQVSFNLPPPTSVHNIFTGWLEGINRKLKSQIIVGASALCWAVWLTRNDIVFNKIIASSYLQAIFRGTYWTRFWSLLEKEEEDCIWWRWGVRPLR
jgi:hypothetical protein